MELNYEKSIERLEQIIKELEEGGKGLEQNIELFAEGTALISKCGKYLDKAEQQITKLLSEDKDAE